MQKYFSSNSHKTLFFFFFISRKLTPIKGSYNVTVTQKKKSVAQLFCHLFLLVSYRSKFVNKIIYKENILNIIRAYFKNPTPYSDKHFQILKRGAVSWNELFSVNFCVRNMGKIVPPPNKNGVFFKSTKTVFTVIKIYLYNLNFSLKLQKKLLSFNTVKTVFVDLKKNTIFIGWRHFFFPYY